MLNANDPFPPMDAFYYKSGKVNAIGALDLHPEDVISTAQMHQTVIQKGIGVKQYKKQGNITSAEIVQNQPTASDCYAIALKKGDATIYLSRIDPTGANKRKGAFPRVSIDSFGHYNVRLEYWFIGKLNPETKFYEWRCEPLQIIDRGENRLMLSGFTN